MAKVVERPVVYRRAWMLLAVEITGKSPTAIRKAVWRMGSDSDLKGYASYLKKELGGSK